jgi:hypothetical protein
MVFDGTGDRTDAEGRAHRDKPVAQHGAKSGGDATPKPTLKCPLYAQHVDGPYGSRHKDSNENPNGNDQRIGQKLHTNSLIG